MKARFPLFRALLTLFILLPTLSGSAKSGLGYEFPITVLDEAGKPMPGVSVFTADQRVATSTDADGKAVLKDLAFQQEVNFTFVGYEALKLPFFEIRKLNGIIRMRAASTELAEVVVIGRRDDLPEQVPYSYDQVTKEQIAFTESQTAADALQNVAGVFVQKTQMGGGSPVLRGFEANRVLLVVDGVRMNTAIYRSGHLQNSITVDNGMLERTEVIYGPGSLMYGSDALGGVIHFRTKEPRLSFDERPGWYSMEGNLFARYSSANNEKSVHADVGYGRRKWASSTSLTFTDYDDLRAGSRRSAGYEDFGKRLFYVRRVDNGDQVIENVTENGVEFKENYNVQVGTAYSQLDFMQKVKFQPTKNFYTIINFQHSTGSDVPRYDLLTELTDPDDPTSFRYAEWYYGPQRRFLGSIKSRLNRRTSLYDRATLIAAHQRTHENRLQRRLHKAQRTFQLEDVWVYSFTADFDKHLDEGRRQQLMYGVDVNYNHVRSEGGKVKIKDETITHDALPRYPANNNVLLMAAYTNYQWRTADTSLTLHAGLRYNVAKLHSQYSADSIIIWPQEFIDPGTKATNSDLTWSGGLTWRASRSTILRAMASKAFRSPNIDDYSQLRPQNGFISVPNPSLQPERSVNGELSVAQTFGRLVNERGFFCQVDFSGYYTRIEGLMTRRPFPLPNGETLLEMEGELLETRANVNARKGIIYGWSGDVLVRMGAHWELSSKLAYTKGRVQFLVNDSEGNLALDTLAALDHIPPLHGQTSLTFFTKKIRLAFTARYQGKKPLSEYGVSAVRLNDDGYGVPNLGGTEDNLEYSYSRRDEDGKLVYDGTLAWTTFNFYSSWRLTKWYSINFAVENITDLHYRPFASGLSAAGRNFILSFRVNLVKS